MMHVLPIRTHPYPFSAKYYNSTSFLLPEPEIKDHILSSDYDLINQINKGPQYTVHALKCIRTLIEITVIEQLL